MKRMHCDTCSNQGWGPDQGLLHLQAFPFLAIDASTRGAPKLRQPRALGDTPEAPCGT